MFIVGTINLKCVKFLQSHPPMAEAFRFCLIVYLYNIFQHSTGSSSDTLWNSLSMSVFSYTRSQWLTKNRNYYSPCYPHFDKQVMRFSMKLIFVGQSIFFRGDRRQSW